MRARFKFRIFKKQFYIWNKKGRFGEINAHNDSFQKLLLTIQWYIHSPTRRYSTWWCIKAGYKQWQR